MAKRAVGVAILVLADAALAHPGHGDASSASWLHGLEPVHLAPVLAACAALLLGFAQRRHRAPPLERRRR